MTDKNGRSIFIMHGQTIKKSIHPFTIQFKEWVNHKGFSLYKVDDFQDKLIYLSCIRYNTRETESLKIVNDSLLKSQIAHELKCADFQYKYRFDFA
jgi:hypothetical protein